jgi:hypothetical protein
MAALNLSAVVIPGVVRKNTLGNATEVRRVILPTEMLTVRGGGLAVCVYPVGTAAYWVSPDVSPQPADQAVYDAVSETSIGYIPADQWTLIPWASVADGGLAYISLTSRDASQVVYVAVYPARVPA